MFVSFLEPYPIRNKKAPFLWVFYKQLMHFNNKDIVFIGSKDYFQDPSNLKNRDEFKQYPQYKNQYEIPDINTIKKYNCHSLDLSIYKPLEEKFNNSLDIYKYLLTQEYEPLIKELENILLNYDNVEAIITWANSPSINKVAKKFNIKVIHNELGPFRKPLYLQTAYFDFSGVNGFTESEKRFNKFLKEDIKLYDIDALRDLFLENSENEVKNKRFDVGIALQVEDDSNLLAYSKGYDSLKLLNEANFFYEKENILIRKHPLGLFKPNEKFGVIDDSKNSIEFIGKCKQILTINSSVGVEALLYETPVCAKGDSSYSFIVSDKLPAKLPDFLKEFLNFYMIGYLIPYELLFDAEYYRFRLHEFSEKVIYKKHLDILLSLRSIDSYENIPLSILKNKYKKLLNECQKLNETVKNKNTKILEYQQAIEEKNIYIEKQRKAIEEKNNYIDRQKKVIEEKNNYIDKQKKVIEEKNIVINNYKEKVENLNKENQYLKKRKISLENEVYMYYMSNSWRKTRIIRKIMALLKGKK